MQKTETQGVVVSAAAEEEEEELYIYMYINGYSLWKFFQHHCTHIFCNVRRHVGPLCPCIVNGWMSPLVYCCSQLYRVVFIWTVSCSGCSITCPFVQFPCVPRSFRINFNHFGRSICPPGLFTSPITEIIKRWPLDESPWGRRRRPCDTTANRWAEWPLLCNYSMVRSTARRFFTAFTRASHLSLFWAR